MKRGIAVVLAVLCPAFATPASAAPGGSTSYVYEVVRLNAKAWPTAYVRLRVSGGLFMYAHLEPDEAGDYRWRSLGSGSAGGGTAMTVDLRAGRRFVIGAVKPIDVHINERYWGVRRIRSGFRWVLPDPAERRETAGRRYEEFTRATAPSGPYGSVVVASVPCSSGAGVWSLRTDDEPEPLVPSVCTSSGTVLDETSSGRSWILSGHVIGNTGSWWPYRLVVLDYPKPPA